MRNIFIVLLMLLLPSLLNCRLQMKEPHLMMRDYALNRVSDLGDIVNIGIEKDTYGFLFYYVFIPIGIQDSRNGEGIGLMYGSPGFYKTGDAENRIIKFNEDSEKTSDEIRERYFGRNDIFIHNSYFYRTSSETAFQRGKYMYTSYSGGGCAHNKCAPSYKGEKLSFSKMGYKQVHPNPAGYFYVTENPPPSIHLEISAGLYLGVRLGLNIPELFDFLFGIVGIDFKEDDIGWQDAEN